MSLTGAPRLAGARAPQASEARLSQRSECSEDFWLNFLDSGLLCVGFGLIADQPVPSGDQRIENQRVIQMQTAPMDVTCFAVNVA